MGDNTWKADCVLNFVNWQRIRLSTCNSLAPPVPKLPALLTDRQLVSPKRGDIQLPLGTKESP